MKYLLVLPLIAFLVLASEKVAPGYYIPGPALNTDGTVWSEDFEDGDISDWTIDGTQNWALSTDYAHTGTYGLQYAWGYSHDTRAITPEITLPTAGSFEISWWWEGSYYWMVDVDHSTFSVEIIESGGTWPGTVLWTENDNDPFPFESFTWYNQFVTLDDTWSGKTIQLGFHLVGNDDADVGLDDILIIDYSVSLERETWAEIKSIF